MSEQPTEAEQFFARPGDIYLIDITIKYMPTDIQFAIKADPEQLPYAKEILTQLAGSIGDNGHLTMTKTAAVDQLPGTMTAYALRPQQHQYRGRHAAPDEDRGPLSIGSAQPIATQQRDKAIASGSLRDFLRRHIDDDAYQELLRKIQG